MYSGHCHYGFDQERLIWYVCHLWDVVFVATGDKHAI